MTDSSRSGRASLFLLLLLRQYSSPFQVDTRCVCVHFFNGFQEQRLNSLRNTAVGQVFLHDFYCCFAFILSVQYIREICT